MSNWKDDKNFVIVYELGDMTVFYSKGGLLGNDSRNYYLAKGSELVGQGHFDTDEQAVEELIGVEHREKTVVQQLSKLLYEYIECFCDERPDNKVWLALRKAEHWFAKLDLSYNRH